MKKLVKRKHNERVWYAVDKYAATRESVQDEGHQELRRERGRVAIILLKDKPLIRLLVHCSSREHVRLYAYMPAITHTSWKNKKNKRGEMALNIAN